MKIFGRKREQLLRLMMVAVELFIADVVVVGAMTKMPMGIPFRLTQICVLCMLLLTAGFCFGFALNTFCGAWKYWLTNRLGIALSVTAIVLIAVACIWAVQLGVLACSILQIVDSLVMCIGFGLCSGARASN